MKELVRVIVSSSTYQLSALPNEHNAADLQNYSHFYPKRMQAEVMLDAIDQLTGANVICQFAIGHTRDRVTGQQLQ
ncbi:MAG: DUF1553 domain-containing protein [Pirellulaceae bacterium]